MPKPVLIKGADGTLTFEVPESSAGFNPTSATVTVHDETGTVTSVSGSAATVTDATALDPAKLSISVGAAIVDAEALNYRATWVYTIKGEQQTRSQTFEVRRSALYQTVTETTFFSRYFPILRGRIAPGGMTVRTALDTAWDRLHAELRALGRNPNLIIDPKPLEAAHAGFTAAVLARGLALTGDTGDVQAWAQDREREAKEALQAAIANCDWYDADQSLTPDGGEERQNLTVLRFSR